MQSIERILAGIEFSPDGSALTHGSLQAIREAAWLADRTNAHLALLHSTWNDEHGEAGPTPDDATLDLALAAAGPAGGAELVLVDERPWLAIVRCALRREADLVCVGRRSKSADPGLGSVTAKLIRKCPAPVWAVRPSAPAPPARILVATDLSATADRATELGLALASFADADLRVLHAWQVPLSLQMSEGRVDDATIEAKRRELQENAIRHIQQTLGKHPNTHVQIHVVCDAPTHAIQHDVEEHRADLVVLGTISRGGIAGFLLGNTAERLLRRIETSVLAVKPADFVCPVEA